MKTILIILCGILLLIVLGWVTVEKGQSQATITIETKDIRNDAHRAVERGKRLLRETKDEVSDEVHSPDSPDDAGERS